MKKEIKPFSSNTRIGEYEMAFALFLASTKFRASGAEWQRNFWRLRCLPSEWQYGNLHRLLKRGKSNDHAKNINGR